MKKPQSVKIIWHDATDVEVDTAWNSAEEAIAAADKEKSHSEVISVGFIVNKSHDYILLAQSVSKETAHLEYCTLFRIPTKWVKSVRKLR